MKRIWDPLKCGGCGGDKFRLLHLRDEDEPRLGGEGAAGTGTSLSAHCLGCGGRSDITVTAPRFVVESKNDDGSSICGGWRSKS